MVGGCNVVGLALLALSVTGGGTAVRAAGDAASLESIALEPVTKMVSGIEQRVAAIESSIAAFAHSFTARRIAVQELCVADGGGAQTCITKAQLDALLKGAVQTAQATPAQATTAPPAGPATEHAEAAHKTREGGEPAACPEKCVAPPSALVNAPSETPPAAEQAAVAKEAAKEPVKEPAKEAVKEAAPASEPPAAAVKEPATVEGRAAAPSATPAAEQPQAAADGVARGEAAPAEAALPTPPAETASATATETKPAEAPVAETKSAETTVVEAKPAEAKPVQAVVAKAGEPETLIQVQPASKMEQPTTTGAAPVEPKAVAADASPVTEHKE